MRLYIYYEELFSKTQFTNLILALHIYFFGMALITFQKKEPQGLGRCWKPNYSVTLVRAGEGGKLVNMSVKPATQTTPRDHSGTLC